MSVDRESLINILDDLLLLHPIDTTKSQKKLLNDVVDKIYDGIIDDSQDESCKEQLVMLIDVEMADKFQLTNISRSFNLKEPIKWQDLFTLMLDTLLDNNIMMLFAIVIRLILSLMNLSLLNKQLLVKRTSLKDVLLKYFTTKADSSVDNLSPILQRQLAEFLAMALSVSSTPTDIMELYQNFKSKHSRDILNILARKVNNKLPQTYLQFENVYERFKFKKNSTKRQKNYSCTIFTQFNNTVINRFMTIDNWLYLEVRDNQCCVATDEYVIALFDGYTFEPDRLYSITFVLNPSLISLYVDGDFINQISLITKPLVDIKSIQMGSVICSFKLFRLWFFREALTKTSIKLLHHIGLNYHKSFKNIDMISDISEKFGDAFFERVATTVHSDNTMTMIDFIKDVDQLKRENIFLIDIDPAKEIYKNGEESNFKIITTDLSLSSLTPAELENIQYSPESCYYYKSSNMVSSFISINCFQTILAQLANCDTIDEVHEYIYHLTVLLQNYHLYNWFEKEFGFTLLAHILSSRVIERLKQPLPIQILNLILKFCGWNLTDITKSLVVNDVAYKSLVLNMDLWYFEFPGKESMGSGEVEIIRFSLFQIGNLLENSQFKEYNSKKLRSMNIIEELGNYQHLLMFRNRNTPIIENLKNDFISVYCSLLLDNTSKVNLQKMLNFGYYELISSNFVSFDIVFITLDKLFINVLSDTNSDISAVLTETVTPKYLLLILDELPTDNRSFLLVLNLLLKSLIVNKKGLSQFVKNAGMDLLFDILKDFSFDYFEIVIYILFSHSIGLFDIDFETFELVNFEREDITKNTTICYPQFLQLACRLLEWSVVNGLQNEHDDQQEQCLDILISKIGSLVKNETNSNAFAPEDSKILVQLSNILILLTDNTENCKTYEKTIVQIQTILFYCFEKALHEMTTVKFESFLDAILNSKTSQNSILGYSTKKNGYLEVSFFHKLLPFILQKLIDKENEFSIKILTCPYMLSNISVAFNVFKQYYYAIKMESVFYYNLLTLLFKSIKIFETSDMTRFKGSTRASLKKDILIIQSTMIYLIINSRPEWSIDLEKIFLNILLKYKSTLFKKEDCIYNGEALMMLVLFLKIRIQNSPNRHLVFLCTKMVFEYQKAHQNLKRINIYETIYTEEEYGIMDKVLHADEETAVSVLAANQAAFNSNELVSLMQPIAHMLRVEGKHQMVTLDEIIIQILDLKKSKLERKIKNIEAIHNLFREDNKLLQMKMQRINKKSFSNFVTDLEEENMINNNNYGLLQFKFTSMIENYEKKPYSDEWKLDSVEDFNRTKRRLLPSWEPTQDYRPLKLDNQNGVTQNTKNERRKSGNSLISYEVVSNSDVIDSPVSSDQKDANRRILKVLKSGDFIQHIWNCSVVIGLDIREGIMILGGAYLYFLSNYYFDKGRKCVLNLEEVSTELRDPAINLINGNSDTTINTSYHTVNSWSLADLSYSTKRPFLLRDVGLEIIFENGNNNFFCFSTSSYRNKVYNALEGDYKLSHIDSVLARTLEDINKRNQLINNKNGISKESITARFINSFTPIGSNSSIEYEATQLWKYGEISNFYYLMILNILAGRTFNDLTQYPVFPWVLADYENETLDLLSSETFRDLSKPMGAQSSKRRNQFIERYEALSELGDENTHPFHYGTHYSSAMIISSYMIRLKPFVNSFLLLQDGKFGVADRLFTSISRAWRSAAVENTTDVRELTPEFFFLPEFLVNLNKYKFGTDQHGTVVNDVILPPWANSDPKIFIKKNRDALESPYVSQHLHEWIDLIFGYKQRGENAVEAVNVFDRLSYPGAINLENIDNEIERRAVTSIIHNFGQTPLQIFDKPHAKRIFQGVYSLPQSLWEDINEYPTTVNLLKDSKISYLGPNSVRNKFGGYKFLDIELPFNEVFHKIKLKSFNNLSIDHILYEGIHTCEISAFAYYKNNLFLTGDKFGLIKLWNYCTIKKQHSLKHEGSFYGHLTGIKEMAVYPDNNILLSIDDSGEVYMWDILKCQMIRTISNETKQCAISQGKGNIAIYRNQNIEVFNLNGMKYCSMNIPDVSNEVSCLKFLDFNSKSLGDRRHQYWSEEDVLFVGFEDGSIRLYELYLTEDNSWNLKILKTLVTGSEKQITCISPILKLDSNNSMLNEIDNADMNSFFSKLQLEIQAGDKAGSVHIWNNRPGEVEDSSSDR